MEGFFKNVQNADKLSGLVEGIRDAMMHYQVCVHERFIPCTSDARGRLLYNRISMIRAVNSL